MKVLIRIIVDTEGTDLTFEDVRDHFVEGYATCCCPIMHNGEDRFPLFNVAGEQME